MRRTGWISSVLCLVLILPVRLAAQTRDGGGQVPQAEPLGMLVENCEAVRVVEVEKVHERQEKETTETITLRVVTELKGKLAERPARYQIAITDDLRAWARPGRQAILFSYEETKSVLYAANHWNHVWWDGEGQPWRTFAASDFATTYVGPVDKLRQHVRDILAGKEVVLAARVSQGSDSSYGILLSSLQDRIHDPKGPVWRIKAGLKVRDRVWTDESPDFVGWGVGGSESIPELVKNLQSPDSQVRAEAAVDLGQLKPAARKALPALRIALEDADGLARISAAEALARIDSDNRDAFPTLVAALRSGAPPVRRSAAAILAGFGSRSRSALPALVSLLGNDPNPNVRRVAAFALGEIAPGSAVSEEQTGQVVDTLARAPGTDSEEVRASAAGALLRFGAAAWRAIPALAGALRKRELDGDGRENARSAVGAADVLARLEPPAVDVLAQVLQEDSPAALHIARSLGQLGTRARSAVPALCGLLADGEPEKLRLAACVALVRIDPKGTAAEVKAALAELAELPVRLPLDDLETLVGVGAGSEAFVPLLLKAAREKGSGRAGHALQILGRLGPAGHAARPALREMLPTGEEWRKIAAAGALWRLGFQGEALPVFLRTLRDGKENRVDFEVLAERGTEARPAAPLLQALLHQKEVDPLVPLALWRIDPPSRSQAEAARAWLQATAGAEQGINQARSVLWSWGIEEFDSDCAQERDVWDGISRVREQLQDSPDVAAALEHQLRHRSLSRRLASAVALARLKPHSPGVAAELAQILEKRPGLFWYLADSLAHLGPQARAAEPWLRQALKHDNPHVYRVAARVLDAVNPQARREVWGPAGTNPEERLRAARRTPGEWNNLWEELASADPVRSYLATWQLAQSGPEAVRFLGRQLRPVPRVAKGQVARLLAGLDSDLFATREKASAELETIVELAEPELRRFLKGRPSPEARRRAEAVLEGRDPWRSPERRRALRAVGLLEHLGTTGACKVLETLAGGAAEANLTREAAAAVERLRQRTGNKP